MAAPRPRICAGLTGWRRRGLENGGQQRSPIFQINNVLGLKEAVRRGLGLAVLPDYVARDDPRLVAVLDGEETLPEFEIYFVYPEEMKASKRIDVFRDFMVAKAKEWSF